jgi:hypothetical protein
MHTQQHPGTPPLDTAAAAFFVGARCDPQPLLLLLPQVLLLLLLLLPAPTSASQLLLPCQ